MKKLTDKKSIRFFVYLCAMIYFVSYLTRINYAATLVEIRRSMRISQAEASMAVTASAISYGIGQLISGYLGDKIQAQKLILTGLIITTAMNVFLPFCGNAYFMAGVWFVNGFAQAMMWPPIVKLMSSMMPENDYKAGCIRGSQGSSVARILMYLAAPVIIFLTNWKCVFFFSAAFSFIMCFVWVKGFRRTVAKLTIVNKKEEQKVEQKEVKYEKFTWKVILILVVVMLTIIIQGALRDSVENWMPTYISDIFNLGSEISILTSIALPILSIVCVQLASLLNRKLIHNELSCVTFTFALGAVWALALAAFGERSMVIAVVSAAFLNAIIHGVNYFQTCLVPIYFASYGKVSFISGLLNSCTYIGSAIATYRIAVAADTYGWNAVTWIWLGLALLGVLLAGSIIKIWHKFKNGSV